MYMHVHEMYMYMYMHCTCTVHWNGSVSTVRAVYNMYLKGAVLLDYNVARLQVLQKNGQREGGSEQGREREIE